MISSEHKTEELKVCANLSKEKYECYFPKKRDDQPCFSVWKEDDIYKIRTGYFIGVDWIEKNHEHISIIPKLNLDLEGNIIKEVDYLKMLFSCLSYDETARLIKELIVVKWDDPQIEIDQNVDMLTPFIIIDFLNVVKRIVQKGLKKSYYKKTKVLNGSIKGKMLIKQTMNMHLSKGNLLNNVCSFDEFGVDNKENRLLKKAIEFIKKYLSVSPLMRSAHVVSDAIGFISPAFELVSADIEVNEIKQMKSNTVFKEYDNGIRLAKMIIKRFGYNISNTIKQKVLTPPFWIDMPMLFELHVLSLLKEKFKSEVNYHFSTYGNELDFLLKSGDLKMVIDAKYIPKWKNKVIHENVRQLSGYARLRKVSDELNYSATENIDCLIIYPDIDDGKDSIHESNFKDELVPVKEYNGFYKLGVKVPVKD